jgi:hypothetical protein
VLFGFSEFLSISSENTMYVLLNEFNTYILYYTKEVQTIAAEYDGYM